MKFRKARGTADDDDDGNDGDNNDDDAGDDEDGDGSGHDDDTDSRVDDLWYCCYSYGELTVAIFVFGFIVSSMFCALSAFVSRT